MSSKVRVNRSRRVALVPTGTKAPTPTPPGKNVADDVKYLNGVPVDSVISPNGTLRPAILKQIYAAFVSGSTKNLCPDSDAKFGTTYWTLAGLGITANAGTLGGNGFTYTGAGAAVGNQTATSSIIGVTPGQKITASVSLDATNCSVNAPQLQVWKGDLSVQYASAPAVLGAEQRISVTLTVPAGVTQLALVFTTNNATIANTKRVVFSAPQVEVGTTVTPYKPNLADDTTGYLKAGAAAVDMSQAVVTNKTLKYIDDDPGSSRFAVLAIDGNRRPYIDFGQAGHLAKHLGNIQDDALSSRYAVLAIDGNRRALVDAGQAGHIGTWSLDSRVADGNTFARTRSNTLLGGVPAWFGQTGKNACPNHGFESNKAGIAAGILIAAGQLCDNWSVQNPSGGIFGLALESDGSSRSGANNLIIRLQENQTIPANTTEFGVAQHTPVQVHQGDIVSFAGWARWDAGAALPAGLTVTVVFRLAVLDSTATVALTQIATNTITGSGGGYILLTGNYTIPATVGGGNPAFIQLWPMVSVQNTTGAPITTSAAAFLADCRFDDLYIYIGDTTVPGAAKGAVDFGDNTPGMHIGKHLGNMPDDAASSRYAVLAIDGNRRPLIDFAQGAHLSKTLTNILDDVTFKRVRAADVGASNQLNLEIGGSTVQLGDARNGRGVTASGVAQGFYWSSNNMISAPDPNDINVAAATLLMGGSGAGNVAYNASTVGGLTANTLYYLYYIDPGYAGGAQTLHATTNKTDLANNKDIVYVGIWTTPVSGSGGNGGPGGCLHEFTTAQIRRAGKELIIIAGEIRVGDEVWTDDGWQPVLQVDLEPHDDWIHVGANRSEELLPMPFAVLTPTQPLYRQDGLMVRASELTPGTILKVEGGTAKVTYLALHERQPANKVIIRIPPPHLFYLEAGSFLVHNGAAKP